MRLEAAGNAASAARALTAAAAAREAAGDATAAARRFLRAASLDGSCEEAARGVLRTAPALERRCSELEERCRLLEVALEASRESSAAQAALAAGMEQAALAAPPRAPPLLATASYARSLSRRADEEEA